MGLFLTTGFARMSEAISTVMTGQENITFDDWFGFFPDGRTSPQARQRWRLNTRCDSCLRLKATDDAHMGGQKSVPTLMTKSQRGCLFG